MNKKLVVGAVLACVIASAHAQTKTTDVLFEKVASIHQLNPELLKAIAQVESNLHPWTLNLNGEPVYPTSKAQALHIINTVHLKPWLAVGKHKQSNAKQRFLLASQAKAEIFMRERPEYKWRLRKLNPESVDVGLMQVNLFWHRDKVDSVEQLLEPYGNVQVAAKILQPLLKRHGQYKGVGFYHNRKDQRRWKTYTDKVHKYLVR